MNFALADILLLWSTILAFIAIVLPQDSIAALLFVPYLIWVSIATALNKVRVIFFFFFLNLFGSVRNWSI